MKKIVIVCCALLFSLQMFTVAAGAIEVAGVSLAKTVSVHDRTLNLNGYGIRKKFFVKVYVGSLYATVRLTSAAAALSDNGDKLIRMNFIHSRVGKEKIVNAFAEGLADNAPDVSGSAEAKQFLSLFKNDFVKGDVVDLFLGGTGAVSVYHNGRNLGDIKDPRLARGVLLIYLGNNPADDDLKSGMLAGR